MNKTKTILVASLAAAAIVLGGVVVITVKQQRQISALEKQVATSQDRSSVSENVHDRARRVVGDSDSVLNPARRAKEAITQLRRLEVFATGKSPEEKTEGHAARRRKNSAVISSGAEAVKRWESLVSDPRVAEEVDSQLKAQVKRRYSALLGEAALSDEKTQQFTAMLIDRRKVAMSVAADWVRDNKEPSADVDTFCTRVTAIRATIDDAKIKPLLGEDLYKRYKSTGASDSADKLVAELRERLAGSEHPLTEQQAEDLTASLESYHSSRAGAAMLAAAPKSFDPIQTEAFKRMVAEKN